MVDGLAVTGDKDAAREQIKALYSTFTDCDCTMVEVSSLTLALAATLPACAFVACACVTGGVKQSTKRPPPPIRQALCRDALMHTNAWQLR